MLTVLILGEICNIWAFFLADLHSKAHVLLVMKKILFAFPTILFFFRDMVSFKCRALCLWDTSRNCCTEQMCFTHMFESYICFWKCLRPSLISAHGFRMCASLPQQISELHKANMALHFRKKKKITRMNKENQPRRHRRNQSDAHTRAACAELW